MLAKNKIVISVGLTGLLLTNYVNASVIDSQLLDEVNIRAGNSTQTINNTNSVAVDVSKNLSIDDYYVQDAAEADRSGRFCVRSKAESDASANSTITQTFSFENQGDDAFFDFNFVVENGSLSISCVGYRDGQGYGTCDNSLAATAAYMADITVNSVAKWGAVQV